MNVLLIADGDIKYGASHSLFQMAKELSSFYEINIQIVMPVTAGFKGELEISNQIYCAGDNVLVWTYLCCKRIGKAVGYT